MYKPILGITIGDDECRPLVFGTKELIERAFDVIGTSTDHMLIVEIEDPDDAVYSYGTINVVRCGEYDLSSLEYGKEQELGGRIAIDAINMSIEYGLKGKIDAVTTAPINKVSIKMVGVKQEGHTEIYRDGTNAPYVLTMFDCQGMRVFHLSRHMSLKNAIDYATKENVYKDIKRIDRELRNIGIATSANQT